jgi:glycerol-3-phosphate dehydrogenase (NAD(P)+)
MIAAAMTAAPSAERRQLRSAPRSSILILGYGAFGRAVHAALSHRDDAVISVYSRSPKAFEKPVAASFRTMRGVRLADYDVVVIALPGHAVREVLEDSRRAESTAYLSCVKGMDPVSGQFPSDVIYAATGSDYIAVMSGASFGDEMLLGRPVFLTLACANVLLGRELIDRLHNEVLQLELSDDVRGLEVAGVGKNIIALGAGVGDGLALGDNFRAAFIARGIVELRRIASKLGARPDTIVVAGALADFFLSCSSPRSRNYSFGLALGAGTVSPELLAEGRHSAEAFVTMLRQHQIESAYFDAIAASLGQPAAISGSLAVRSEE